MYTRVDMYIYIYIHDMLCVYMTFRPGVKDDINPHFCSILGLRSSCPPLCHTCGNKWSVVGGGLCAICRSLDRLAAIARGPEVPAAAEQEVLTFLRGWICSLQDLGELFPLRNMGAGICACGDLCQRPLLCPVATTPKAVPAPPPLPLVPAAERTAAERSQAVEEEGPPEAERREVAIKEFQEEKGSPPTRSRHRKRSRRARSGRSRTRHQASVLGVELARAH